MCFNSNLKLVTDLEITSWIKKQTRPWPSEQNTYRGIGWVIPEGFESYIAVQDFDLNEGLDSIPLEYSRLILLMLEFTSEPRDCYMALWFGFGWDIEKVLGIEGQIYDFFEMPNRNYYVFEGPLNDAVKIGYKYWKRFNNEIPNYVWPRDKSWVMVKEIDHDVILIGGSVELINAIENSGCFTTQRFDMQTPYWDLTLTDWEHKEQNNSIEVFDLPPKKGKLKSFFGL